MTEHEITPVEKELDILAPHLLEVMDALSGDDRLKYVLYSVLTDRNGSRSILSLNKTPFALYEMMGKHDPQIAEWQEQSDARRESLKELENQRARDFFYSTRADLKKSDVVEFSRVGRNRYVELKDHAKVMLQAAFKVGKGWWPEVYEVVDIQGKLVDWALIAQSPGSQQWVIGVDEETGQLAFGDKFFNHKYDFEKHTFIGIQSASDVLLNSMGRAVNDSEVNREGHYIRDTNRFSYGY